MPRNRDAGTGRIVSKAEAQERPRETVAEKGNDRLAKLERRVAKLEKAVMLGEAGARQLYSEP